MNSLRIHILLCAAWFATPLLGEHYRGAAGQQQQQQAPRNSSQMMSQQGQGGGGGGQGQQGGKSREAAEKSIKDGEEVRKALTKTSEQFAQGANKLTENFNSALAGLSKNNSEDEFKDLLKQIKETSTVSSTSATTTVIDEIISGYKAQADLLVKKAQLEAAAIAAAPKQELTVKPTTFDKLSASGGRGGSALGDALSVSSAASESIPSLSGGSAVTRSPSSIASSQGTTGPVSSNASASEPPPSIGSHAKGVR